MDQDPHPAGIGRRRCATGPTERGPGWLAADDLGEVAVEPWVALLPTLDPTTMGWKHRGWYLSERAATDAFDRAGNAAPTIWVDGRVVGTWAQREDREIRLHWFDDVPTSRRAQVEARAEEVAAWVGTPATGSIPQPAAP